MCFSAPDVSKTVLDRRFERVHRIKTTLRIVMANMTVVNIISHFASDHRSEREDDSNKNGVQ